MNSCFHCKSLKAKAWQTWTDCCEIARTIPHSILGMEHCCGMSHLARSNPHQHGSYYPHHSLECAGITAPPPAPPLWQHTHTPESAAVWIFIPRSVFPIRTTLPLSLPHLTELTGENGSVGSITSQTVACSPSTCHGALTREILNNSGAITEILCGGKDKGIVVFPPPVYNLALCVSNDVRVITKQNAISCTLWVYWGI